MNDALSVLWASLSMLLLLVLPGLSWGAVLLQQDAMRWPARLLVSVGLSMVIMPLTVFWLNLTLGVPVTVLSLALMTLSVSAVPGGLLAWKRWGAR